VFHSGAYYVKLTPSDAGGEAQLPSSRRSSERTATKPVASRPDPPGRAAQAPAPRRRDQAWWRSSTATWAGQVKEKVALYDSKPFDYIDGGAPVFIERGFRKLAATSSPAPRAATSTAPVYTCPAENAKAIFEKGAVQTAALDGWDRRSRQPSPSFLVRPLLREADPRSTPRRVRLPVAKRCGEGAMSPPDDKAPRRSRSRSRSRFRAAREPLVQSRRSRRSAALTRRELLQVATTTAVAVGTVGRRRAHRCRAAAAGRAAPRASDLKEHRVALPPARTNGHRHGRRGGERQRPWRRSAAWASSSCGDGSSSSPTSAGTAPEQAANTNPEVVAAVCAWSRPPAREDLGRPTCR
jgi:hypothetical protein